MCAACIKAARCSPHPSRGQQRFKVSDKHAILACGMQPAPLTGTATSQIETVFFSFEMQPAPLTGTATTPHSHSQRIRTFDAARTPHGDSNGTAQVGTAQVGRCSPHPSRGQKKAASHKVLCDAVFSSVKGRLKAAVIARPCAGAAPSRRGHRRTPSSWSSPPSVMIPFLIVSSCKRIDSGQKQRGNAEMRSLFAMYA